MKILKLMFSNPAGWFVAWLFTLCLALDWWHIGCPDTPPPIHDCVAVDSFFTANVDTTYAMSVRRFIMVVGGDTLWDDYGVGMPVDENGCVDTTNPNYRITRMQHVSWPHIRKFHSWWSGREVER